MSTTIPGARRLDFMNARPPPGTLVQDTLVTGRVTLDQDGPTYALAVRWRPVAESWYLDLKTTAGVPIVLGVALRDRVDCLLGVSTPGRPAGALISYDPKGRGNPTLTSYADGTVGLWYLPAGYDPYDFAVYQTEVV